jgi:hypothetical protein
VKADSGSVIVSSTLCFTSMYGCTLKSYWMILPISALSTVSTFLYCIARISVQDLLKLVAPVCTVLYSTVCTVPKMSNKMPSAGADFQRYIILSGTPVDSLSCFASAISFCYVHHYELASPSLSNFAFS